MAGDNRQDAYAYLLNLATQQGYVTFDNIIDAADRWKLPINEVDWLSNSITTRGILVYDEAPEETNKVNVDDEYSDYAQSDYEAIFKKVIQLEPTLESFIDEIRLIRPPQYRELSGIIYQAKEGNRFARNRIVEMHLRMAVRIGLQRAELYDADLVDCIGDACVGLLKAVDHYNPDTSGPFGSYASLWMLQNIRRYQPTQLKEVYYPAHMRENYFTMYPLLKEYGCVYCDKVFNCLKVRTIIKERLCLDIDRCNEIAQQCVAYSSFDELVDLSNYDYDQYIRKCVSIGLKLQSLVYDSEIDLMVEKKVLQQELDDALTELSYKEQKVLRLRYGFYNTNPKTLEEVGKVIGVTKERIRQIEDKAFRKLRSVVVRRGLI